MDLKKRNDENEEQYIWRIGQLKKQGLIEKEWEELGKLFNSQCREDDAEWTSSAYRKPYQSAERFYENVFKHMLNNQEYINEIDLKTQQLQKEKYKVQTEKLELNKWLREDARNELFMEKIIDAIKSNENNCRDVNPIPIINSDREYVLCLADAHFGKDFKIFGLQDEIINEYSPETFYNRMDQVFSETINYVERENINKIKVFNLGDSLEGFIRNSQIWTLRYGVVDSAMIYGMYMGKWLKELSKYVLVEYHQTNGNHCELRLLDGKKEEHLNENIEKIVAKFIECRNEDNPNFTIVSNKTGLIFTKVAGYNILGIHGEVKNGSQAIKDFSDIYNTKLDVLIMGHKHHGNFINCGYRKQSIGIGSIIGSDDFSMKIKKQADATASILCFEKYKGKVNDYTIVLN